MRAVALIDEDEGIGRILRHLGFWKEGVRACSGTGPPPDSVVEAWLDDPFPDSGPPENKELDVLAPL